MVVLYYYDAGQQPRWALGSASKVDFGSEITVDMLQFSGFCLNCAPGGVEPAPAGTVRLRLITLSLRLHAGNIADVEFSGPPDGTRLKADAPIQLLSAPEDQHFAGSVRPAGSGTGWTRPAAGLVDQVGGRWQPGECLDLTGSISMASVNAAGPSPFSPGAGGQSPRPASDT